MWQAYRRKKLLSVPFPPEGERMVAQGCPWYQRLPVADQQELKEKVQIFLAEKKFEGCGGLVITEEMRLDIAAEACLLLLHRPSDYYPALRTILVYPTSYFVPTTRPVGLGVWEEGWQARSGESWQAGAVVLAWADSRPRTDAPRLTSVVLHEFAHQLDYENGAADGTPALGAGQPFFMRGKIFTQWKAVMDAEFSRLQGQIQRGEPTFLRPYAAMNPAEFFAVATEAFFLRAEEMKTTQASLYQQLALYYRQDPTLWRPPTPSAADSAP